MRCQIPGCKNKGIVACKKDGIFLGVHLENVMVWVCKEHSTQEVDNALQLVGEDEASALQHECNPFLDAAKICPHQA